MLSFLAGVTAETVITPYPEHAVFIDGYGVKHGVSFTTEYGFQYIFPRIYPIDIFKVVQV